MKLTSTNPASGESVGEVVVTEVDEVEIIVQRGRGAFVGWRDLGVEQRAEIIKEAQLLLLERAEGFAQLITLEMGRPYVESLAMEVNATIDMMKFYAKKGKKFLSDRWVPLGHPLFKRRGSRFHFEPLGVLGVIAPWNWPLLIPMGCIVPALLSGNAVIFKHSELTPLLAAKMCQLFRDAGVPEAVMQVIQGTGAQGKALVDSSIEKIFFTGSTAVGKKVLQQTAKTLKKAVLELGGSDPAIVCADADIDITSSGIAWGAFNNCGQNCNAIERVFVHESIAESFTRILTHKVEQLKIGDGMDDGIDLGPLSGEAQFKKIKKIINQEVKNGGKILCGGQPFHADQTGFFYQPTIIQRDKSVVQPRDLEFFGPILAITAVEDDEEAIRLANDSAFGLSSSVWTSDRGRGRQIAHRLEAGTTMINDSIVSFGFPEADWTGVKESGVGWVHGEKGLNEMVNIKYINYEPQYKTQKFWWFPYTGKMLTAIKKAMDMLFAGNLKQRLAAIPGTVKHFTSYLLLNRKRKNKL